MLTPPLLSLVLSFLALTATASPVSPDHAEERATELPLGLYNPAANGGSWLTVAPDTGGLGEPINTVLSANSDYFVLTEAGYLDWMVSIDFAGECLGQHEGGAQQANLGDGQGLLNQTAELRYDYGNPSLGTCQETIDGGNHLRYWFQNGSAADSGAIFMAVSLEQNLTYGHNIETPDGYDGGRDALVGNATAGSKSPLTNRTFTATVTMVSGFLAANSSAGINHGLTIDGLVAVLTVKVASNATSASSSAGSATSGASAILQSRKDWTRAGLSLGLVFLAVLLIL